MKNMTLEQMKNIDIREVDINDLVDIRDIKINEEKSKEERIRDFIKQVGNPYCYRVGKVVVKLNFT